MCAERSCELAKKLVPSSDVFAAAIEGSPAQFHSTHTAADRLIAFHDFAVHSKLRQKERGGQSRCASADDDPTILACHNSLLFLAAQCGNATLIVAVPQTTSCCEMEIFTLSGNRL